MTEEKAPPNVQEKSNHTKKWVKDEIEKWVKENQRENKLSWWPYHFSNIVLTGSNGNDCQISTINNFRKVPKMWQQYLVKV